MIKMGIYNILYFFNLLINQLINRNLVHIDANNVEEVVEDDIVGEDPLEDPRLRPHGQLWEDLGEINVDPVANQRYNLPFRLNWGQLVVERHNPIKALTYFLLLFPMTFLFTVVIVHMNEKLREARKQETNKAEVLRMIGLTLSMALDPTRGGVRSYWDENEDLEGTIYQKKSYATRFNMTRHRFEDLRRYMTFGPMPEDIVSYYIIIYRLL